MKRFLQEPITSKAIMQNTALINGAMFSSIILLLMLLATPSFATCYNVHDGGAIGYDKSICSGESVTISNVNLPSGGNGSLQYAWLFNTSEPSFSGSSVVKNSNSSYTLTYVTQTVWVRRCARRAGCNSWDYGESNWVKITVNNAEFEHVNGVNESACDANNGQIITDPYINQGTALPYNVQYTLNGTTITTGPFTKNADNYITGLAPGLYEDITMIDANGCTDIYGDITIQEYDCGNVTIDGSCELNDHGFADNHPGETRLIWLRMDNSDPKEYAVEGSSTLLEYSDSTALLSGTVVELGNSNNRWYYSVKLIQKRDWATWSALDRSYKPNNFISGEDHTTWTYYMLDNNNSTFIGLGDLAGKTLHLTHSPGTYEFGFQIGFGANDKDASYGLSGWFAFTGSYSGNGDFNGDLACEGSIGNLVFDDANANGIKDVNEAGIEGVTVVLLDENENIIEDTTTDEFGIYSFENLSAGDYKVQVLNNVVADGMSYTLTNPDEGSSDDLDSDGVRSTLTPGSAMTPLITIQPGRVITNIDFGYIKSASLGDMAFKDNNSDGLMDVNDDAFKDVLVALTGTDVFGNAVSLSDVTDEFGKYAFSNLTPGAYYVSFTSPEFAFIPTEKDALGNGSDDKDSDINPGSGRTDAITLNAGDANKTIDAGFIFDSSLPVALTSFEAQLVNTNQVILKWSTASEENNRHFIVERSSDGRDFEPIGVVTGNGTTNTVNYYNLDDRDPFYGNNYYRLKQVDFNGDYEYSDTETVLIAGDDLPDVIVYPNPVVRKTTLRVVTPFEQDATIEIVDQTGKITQTLTILQGANSKQLDLSEHAPGLYFAYINYNGHRTLVYTIVKVEE